jgi:hypothetical protein
MHHPRVCLSLRLEDEVLRRQGGQYLLLSSSYLGTDCPLEMLEGVGQERRHMLQLVIHQVWTGVHSLNEVQLVAPVLSPNSLKDDRRKER